MPIVIKNYLGGAYYFTVDDVILDSTMHLIYLIESKHSQKVILPSENDIKDGLLKLMLYNNLAEVYLNNICYNYKVVLRLTSPLLKSVINLPTDEKSLTDFIKTNKLDNKSQFLAQLNEEASANNFEVWINKV